MLKYLNLSVNSHKLRLNQEGWTFIDG